MRTVSYLGTSYAVSDSHPVANVLPWHLDTDEFNELVESIRTHGFDPERPVIRCRNSHRVFSGRRRELACRVAGVQPVYRDVDWTDEAAVAWVRRDDLRRRNLTGVERVAAELALDGILHRVAGVGANQHTAGEGGEGGTRVPPVVTAGEIAKRAGVSRKTVQRVKKAGQHPALLAAVTDGRIPAKLGAELADLPADEIEDVLASDDPSAEAADTLRFYRYRAWLDRLESEPELLDVTLRQKLSPSDYKRVQSLPRRSRATIAADDEPGDVSEYCTLWREQIDRIRRRAPEVAAALTAGVLDQDAAVTAACLSPAHRAEVLAAAHPPAALRELIERKFSGQMPITALADWSDHAGDPIDMDTVADLVPKKVWVERSWVAFQHLPDSVLVAQVHACDPSVGVLGQEWFVSLMAPWFMFGSRRPMKALYVAMALHNWGFDLRAAEWHLTDDPPATINPLTRQPLYDYR